MKLKIFITIVLTSLSLSASANREELKQIIAITNAQMPMSAGMLGTMTSVTMTGDETV